MATRKKDGRKAKGAYYAKRTLLWCTDVLGMQAAITEWKRAVPKFYPKGHPLAGRIQTLIYQTCDLWGADLVARDHKRIVFIQVKSNRGHIAAGKRELSKGPWPPHVERWVVFWPPRRRLLHGPEIHEVRPRERNPEWAT